MSWETGAHEFKISDSVFFPMHLIGLIISKILNPNPRKPLCHPIERGYIELLYAQSRLEAKGGNPVHIEIRDNIPIGPHMARIP